MKKTDDEWPRLLKEEADDYLFDGLRFDSRMKDRVRQSIQAEQKEAKRKTTGWKAWMGRGRNRWLAGSSAALIAGIVLVSAYMLGDFKTYPAPGASKPPSGTVDIQPVPLMGVGGTQEQANDTWTLPDMKTARAWFGDRFKAPTYAPDQAVLDAIHATGPRKGTATRIVMSFATGHKSYQITQVKTDSFRKIHNSEVVNIHGVDGYVRTEKDPLTTDLQWYDQGVQYSIIGLLSKEEAISIARSLQ